MDFSLAGLGSEKEEEDLSYEEKKALEKKRRSALRALNRERREKHRKLEEEREAVRQQLREKYNLNKPTSIDEPEEDQSESSSASEGEDEEEDEEAADQEKLAQEERLEKLARKLAVLVSSLVTGLFSMYLLVSFVHLKIKASVSNMRPFMDIIEL